MSAPVALALGVSSVAVSAASNNTVPKRTVLSDIAFYDFETENLTLAGSRLVEQLIWKINAAEDVTEVLVIGHVHPKNPGDHISVSEKHARKVRDYMVLQGLEPHLAIAVGMGTNQPVTSNTTAEGRARNRRVEVVIRRKDKAETPVEADPTNPVAVVKPPPLKRIAALPPKDKELVQRAASGEEERIVLGGGSLFAPRSDRLSLEGKQQLLALADSWRTQDDLRRLIVIGFTDSRGKASANLALSLKRAAAVRNVLVEGGMPGHQVAARGLGEDKPIASNETLDGRAKNRRVEILVERLPVDYANRRAAKARAAQQQAEEQAAAAAAQQAAVEQAALENARAEQSARERLAAAEQVRLKAAEQAAAAQRVEAERIKAEAEQRAAQEQRRVQSERERLQAIAEAAAAQAAADAARTQALQQRAAQERLEQEQAQAQAQARREAQARQEQARQEQEQARVAAANARQTALQAQRLAAAQQAEQAAAEARRQATANAPTPNLPSATAMVQASRAAQTQTVANVQLLTQPPAEAMMWVVSPQVAEMFADRSSTLTPAGRAWVAEVAAALRGTNLAERKVEVIGHSHARGTEQHSAELSAQRAQAVRVLLQRFGVSQDRLLTRVAAKNGLDTGPAHARAAIQIAELQVKLRRASLAAEEPAQLIRLAGGNLFDYKQSSISLAGQQQLDAIAVALNQATQLNAVAVVGYTDNVGSAAYNQRLSLRRAKAVQAYLQKAGGVPEEVLSARGQGENSPIADNSTEQGRAQNRRVELLVYGAQIQLDEAPKPPVAVPVQPVDTGVVQNGTAVNAAGSGSQSVTDALILTLGDRDVFAYRATTLNPLGAKRISSLASLLKEAPISAIKVIGHTDNVGSESYNKRLSKRRANEVRKRLINGGVKPALIEAIGAGESQPVADNSSDEGKARNRRVDIQVFDAPPGIEHLARRAVSAGERIDFSGGTLFSKGQAKVSAAGRDQVVALVTGILERPDEPNIRITGHTDSRGSKSGNVRLSQARAEAVKAIMVEYGLAPAKIEAVGEGARYPVADNDTDAGRARNRRVEIEVQSQ